MGRHCALLAAALLAACVAVGAEDDDATLKYRQALAERKGLTLQQEIDNHRRQAAELDSQKLRMQADLSTASFAAAQLQLEVTALDRTRSGLSAALSAVQKQEHKLLADATDAAAAARGFMQERAALQAKKQGSLERTAELEARRNQTEARVALLSADLKALEAELAKARSDYASAVKVYQDRDADLSQLVSDADGQRSQLMEEVKQLLARKAGLTRDIATLSAAVQRLSAERSGLQAAVGDLRKATEVLAAELKTQTAAADAAEKAIGACVAAAGGGG